MSQNETTTRGEIALHPVTGPGQIRVGDTIVMNISGEDRIERVTFIHNAETPDEEIGYDERRNLYFITRVAVKGTPYIKNVRVLRAEPEGADETRDALEGLVEIIEKAGLLNLSRGVQLGPTVWYVKASERLDYAKRVLGERKTL